MKQNSKKITESQLRQIVKESVEDYMTEEQSINEGIVDAIKRVPGMLGKWREIKQGIHYARIAIDKVDDMLS